MPVLGVAFIDGVDLATGFDAHVAICQDKFPNGLQSKNHTLHMSEKQQQLAI